MVDINSQQRGFTLIEIMAVLVIAGLMTTLAAMSLGHVGYERQLGYRLQRLASLVRLSEQEAVLNNRPVGIEFGRHRYRFWQFDGQHKRWQPTHEAVWLHHVLAQPYYFELQVNGALQHLAPELSPQAAPQIIVSPAGLVTPFVLHAKNKQHDLYQLTVNYGGEVTFIDEDNVDEQSQ